VLAHPPPFFLDPAPARLDASLAPGAPYSANEGMFASFGSVSQGPAEVEGCSPTRSWREEPIAASCLCGGWGVCCMGSRNNKSNYNGSVNTNHKPTRHGNNLATTTFTPPTTPTSHASRVHSQTSKVHSHCNDCTCNNNSPCKQDTNSSGDHHSNEYIHPH
jgi:hypothetical protein